VQIQQRQHRGDLGAAPTPARQDHALELHPLAGGRVDPPVIYPGTDHLDLAGRGSERAGRCVAVTHHQPVATLVDHLGVGAKVGIDLSLQRGRQQPPGALTDQLVQIAGQLGPCLLVGDYTQHRGVPSRRRSPAGVHPFGHGGRYAALSCQGLIHRFRP
jgi:hypothetical protein